MTMAAATLAAPDRVDGIFAALGDGTRRAIFRMVASTVSPINGQRSGSAAVTPCEASNANASAASRAFGLSSGSDASTLRAAATRPRGSVSSPA